VENYEKDPLSLSGFESQTFSTQSLNSLYTPGGGLEFLLLVRWRELYFLILWCVCCEGLVESNIAILWCVCCEGLVEINIRIFGSDCCEGLVESSIAILWCVCCEGLVESSIVI
jgi:hypothetical protein